MTSWAWSGFAARIGLEPADLEARCRELWSVAESISANRTEATAVMVTCAAYAAHHNGGNAKVILDMMRKTE